VKVGDFGLSISTVNTWEPHLTSKGAILGTPAYASPEQLRGDDLDQRSDIYGVGVTLFYLLTGKVPFEADNMVKLVATVLEKPAPSPAAIRPDLPRELAGIVQQCLAKLPERRFKTYGELRQALLPFSSLVPQPAPWGARLLAGMLDLFLVGLLGWLMLWIGKQAGSILLAGRPGSPRGFIERYLCQLLVLSLYYVLPEGLWGASVGKRLLRLRVAGPNQQRPGIWRALGRTAIFCLVPTAPTYVYLFINPEPKFVSTAEAFFAVAIMYTYYALLALLFITARRRNGYAGMHELATGTRVLARPQAAVRPALTVDLPLMEGVSAGERQIGPYHILEHLGVSGAVEWFLGYDPRLLRKVWICQVAPGTPPVSPALRALGRPGRLRWLSGQRGSADNWDAFEAPTGQSLASMVGHPQPWEQVRFWLLDIAEELAWGAREGNLPETLAPERVWITAQGRAKLLDVQAPGVEELPGSLLQVSASDVEPLKEFLYQVAVTAITGRGIADNDDDRRLDVPLPLHARTLLEGLPKVQRLEVFSAQLQPLLTRTATVTRARRASLLAACLALPVLAVAFMVGVQFCMRMVATDRPELRSLQKVLQLYAPAYGPVTPVTTEEKQALEVLLAGRFRGLIADPATWTNFYMALHVQPAQRAAAERVLADHPTAPSALEEERAARIVEPLMARQTGFDEFERMDPLLLVGFFFASTLLMYVAVPSVVTALCFRGGLLWLTCGVTAVTRTGKRACRVRVAWRDLVAWLPMIAWFPLIGYLLATHGAPWAIGAIVLFVALYAALAIVSVFLPGRGLADRLAGTRLVMR